MILGESAIRCWAPKGYRLSQAQIGLAVLLCLILPLLTNTGVVAILLLSFAVLCGLIAINLCGGLNTAMGALVAVVLARVVLGAIVIKTLLWQNVDDLLSPITTPAVMAAGFFGLLLGVWVWRILPKPAKPLLPSINTGDLMLSLAVVAIVLGSSGYLIGLAPSLSGQEVVTGGIFGIARNFARMKSLAIVPAMLYAWSKDRNRIMTHPLVLLILGAQIVVGIASTSKQDAVEPLVLFVAVGICRYGITSPKILSLILCGAAYYGIVVYPFSQYVRAHGGREGDLHDRTAAMADTLYSMATDDNFLTLVKSETDRGAGSYLHSQSLDMGRFAMIGEADRLIYATEATQEFTGWTTITWGPKLLMPSFLYPNKPVFGAGNYLAHIAGDCDASNTTTQFSYGLMANLFNAFGLPGAAIGTAGLFALLFYVLTSCWGNPVLSRSPDNSTLSFFVVVCLFHHSLVEETFAGLIGQLSVPIIVAASFGAAIALSKTLPYFRRSRPGNDRRNKGNLGIQYVA